MTWGHDKSKVESATGQDFMRSCYIMRISDHHLENVEMQYLYKSIQIVFSRYFYVYYIHSIQYM